MEKFAKLFEFEDNTQVLLTVGFNPEEDMHELVFTTNIHGGKMDMTFSFHEREKALKAMREQDVNKVKKLRAEWLTGVFE